MPQVASIDGFTPAERKFIESYALGMTQTQAAKAAGYENPAQRGRGLLLRQDVQDAIAALRVGVEEEANVTRSEFIEGMKEAIEMAQRLSDPIAMIAGWRELGKACGYYAEEKKKVEVTVNGQVMHQLASMSDEELMKLIEKKPAVIDVTPEPTGETPE